MIAYFIGGSRDLTKQVIPNVERWLCFLRPCSFGGNRVEEEHYVYITQIHRSLDAALRPDKDERVHVYALSHVTTKSLEARGA
jgi:hypothetical protein